eukprot:CAMPEP_0172301438 /NCGR_PEP_ID=MMETSP1058-20130122/3326_1 /TAXON_ID=83371 /ORGANISM="Detonula confervacea, Strain CCMP 353" /LENGTH=716 /DNA_ID=CAMNT_0013011551 /DNA_START=78 /DNA_END=2228 /DNA_ORIENTATION=+
MSNNTAPTNSQHHVEPVRRVSNSDERDESSTAAGSPITSSIRPLSKTLHSFRSGSSRASWVQDRNNFRSSLQTIESAAASSVDIYDDDGEDENSTHDMRAAFRGTFKRRSSSEMIGSSSQTLMVSFSRLNEQELSHLRKWNRRLQRTEVFNMYYFPAKWEANEMEALIGFLKLEDPSLKTGGSIRGGSLRGSGKKRQSPNESGLRRSRQNRASNASSGGLSSSFTLSLKDSAGKLSKLLTDPKQNTVDPAKATKHALDFIFFPFIHDPKSVLLKRGTIFIHDASLHNERELMIFTHGFLLANVVLEDAFSLFLALSDREFLTSLGFLDYLENKFREMDDDNNGEIEKWELQKLFTDMGIPMGESVLDELIQRSINSATPQSQCEKVGWEALHQAVQGFFVQQNNATSSATSVKSLGLDDSSHGREGGNGRDSGNGLKKLFGAFQRGKKTTKVEHATLFSDVARVDSLNICHGDDSVSRELANSAYALTSFSVTLHDRMDDPLIFVCSKPEHRDSWVDAFKPGVVHALSKQSAKGMSELRNKLGWQHLVIRSSLTSLAILNDVEALERACKEDSAEGSRYCKAKLELNQLDEYNGYSPLHYATILGHIECMRVLVEAGSKVTLEDREGSSPMYHALSLRNDEVANVLEKFGVVDRTDDLRKLVDREIQAEGLKNASLKQASGRLQTYDESSSLALDSEGDDDIDALLMEAATRFGFG